MSGKEESPKQCDDSKQQDNKSDGATIVKAGKQFGPYEIIKAIGKGKFAVVYRAKRITDGEVVALKRISVDAINDKAREKCLKEIRLVQSLDHPNIIRYMDSFISDNDLVIVFEWAAAGDLKRQLRKALERGVNFDERIIWKYFSQIAEAIRHMHERRIMHRDLKPANIFLTLDGTIMVGDLGLSRELSEHTVQAHSKVGTPLYMSPEVLRGDGYDFKSDVWSLGCLLYELAMLKSPFKSEGLNLYALFQKISQGDYQPLPDMYSEELRSLTYRMISTDATDRPEVSEVCEISGKMRKVTTEKARAERAAKQSNNNNTYDNNNNHNDNNNMNGVVGGMDATLGPKLERQDSGVSSYTHGNGATTDNLGLSRWNSDKTSTTTESKSPRGGASGKDRDREKDKDFKGSDINDNDYDSGSRRHYSNRHSNDRTTDNDGRPRSRSNSNHTFNLGQGPGPSLGDSPPQKHSQSNSQSNSHSQSQSSGGKGLSRKNSNGSNSNKTEKLRAASHLFGVMEMLHDKLSVLHRWTEDQLLSKGDFGLNLAPELIQNFKSRGDECLNGLQKFHFCCELSLFGISKLNGNTMKLNVNKDKDDSDMSLGDGLSGAAQYQRMAMVGMWLCELCRPGLCVLRDTVDLDESSPISVAKRLLKEAETCGVRSEIIRAVTPPLLAKGYGEAVCAFLLGLADSALKVTQFRFDRMNYTSATGVDNSNSRGPAGGEIEDDSEDDIVDETDTRDKGTREPVSPSGSGMIPNDHYGFGYGNSNQNSPSRTVDDLNLNHSSSRLERGILHSSIDPQVWRDEAERVGTQLTLAAKDFAARDSGTWAVHTNKLVNLSTKIKQQVNGDNSNTNTENDTSALEDELRAFRSELCQDRDRILRGERLINAYSNSSDGLNNSPAVMRDEYEPLARSLVDLQKRQSEAIEKNERLQEELSEVEEQLALLLETMNSKSGGDGDGVSRVQEVKDATRQLQKEIRELDLTTAMTQSSLLKFRQEALQRRMDSRRKRANRRKEYRNSFQESLNIDLDEMD